MRPDELSPPSTRPQGVFDRLDELLVSSQFFRSRTMRPRFARDALADIGSGVHSIGTTRSDRGGLGRKLEADLSAAIELDIDLREQFGVEQRAVLDPVAAIDPVSRTQRVERELRARMPLTGDRHSIDHPIERDRFETDQLQLGIEKTKIEPGIVRHQRGIAQKRQQFVSAVFDKGLVSRKEIDRPCTASAACGMSRSGL